MENFSKNLLDFLLLRIIKNIIIGIYTWSRIYHIRDHVDVLRFVKTYPPNLYYSILKIIPHTFTDRVSSNSLQT